jgi:UDP-N-acetylmuramoyl-L-alanyl-D-glutamate--2,6-diaminopimelate ligase
MQPPKRSWPLSTLLTIADTPPFGHHETMVSGVAIDSRQVQPGDLFIAAQGTKLDGLSFAKDAVENGAVAILASDFAALDPALAATIACIRHPNPRQALARLAGFFYPEQPAFMAAVTGTNGKTSTAEFARQLWQKLGNPAASLGTLGVKLGEEGGDGDDLPPLPSLTTPDPLPLHQMLAALAKRGVQHAILEAGSEGLAQHRSDAIALQAAVFTNLTQDHLNYHGTMEAYFAAKLRLFATLLPQQATAVINTDTPHGEQVLAICRQRGHRLITFGQNPAADLRFVDWQATLSGQTAGLQVEGQQHQIQLPLIGQFQLYNLLGAVGVVMASGYRLEQILPHLGSLHGVAGRAELIGHHPDHQAAVIVDYAHTPDALENILSSVRQHTSGKLHVLFGCGGNRDTTKRPLMGAIAARMADVVTVTDDNPRFEDAATIRAAILAACPNGLEMGDRAHAIRHAIGQLNAGDSLVIAGKGHEQGQLVNGITQPFDDKLVALQVLQTAAPKKAAS